MSSPILSVMPWEISEILAIIISHLDQKSLARSARVCKDWTGIALDGLWRDIDDLSHLLNLLSPFSKPEKGTNEQGNAVSVYKFKRPLTSRDWTRFMRYSVRVRRIVYYQQCARTWRKHLDSSVFRELSRTCRDPGQIFPNLQSLTWYANTEERQLHSLFFMQSRGLRYLEIRLHPSTESLPPCSMLLPAHLPHLTHLTLRFTTPVRRVECEAMALLRSLSKLQKLTVPLYAITAPIMETLAALENLSDVTFSHPSEFENGSRMDVETFSPVLHEGVFPHIRRLCFSARLPDAILFLRSPFFPDYLSSLYVHVLMVDGPEIVQQFFLAVKDSCPALTDIHVDFMICPEVPITVPGPPPNQRPSITTFRPLFACRRIASFEFRWDYPLNLTDRDMEEFATSWPALEHLLLNCEPVIEHDAPQLTLKALLPFAYHCRHLRELGLYIDADVPPPDPTVIPFKSLQKLRIGASKITDSHQAALFLSQMFSLECNIVPGLRWPDAYGMALDDAGIFDERRMRINEYWVRWSEVVKILPIVTRVRVEEKARRAALQRKLELLTKLRLADMERCAKLEQEIQALRRQCML